MSALPRLPANHPIVRRAGVAVLAMVAVYAATMATAEAQSGVGCGASIGRWADGCRAVSGVRVVPEACLQGRVIVRAAIDGADPIRVEIGPAGGNAFVREGSLALSPIGDFPDWSRTPPGHRLALDGLRACVRADAPFAVEAREGLRALRERAWSPSRPVWPWRLLGGLAVLLALALRTARARPRRGLRAGATAALVALAAMVAHRALTPAALFHQNGQGPLWVRYALGEACPYGLGYFEVYSHVAARAPSGPEAAIAGAQSVAVAVASAALWWALRALGVSPALALAGAAVVASEPALARMARSESYAGTCFALLTVALAAAAVGARAGRVRSSTFVAATLSAGLLVAQAARIHPVCWMPAALIPVAVFTGVGSRARRGRLAVASAALIGLVVAASSGPGLVDVLTGPLGRHWLPVLAGLQRGRAAVVVGLLVAAAVAVRSGWRSRPWLTRVGGALAVSAVGVSTTVEGPAPVWVYHSVALLFAPTFAAAALGALRPATPTRRLERRLALALTAVALLTWGAFRAPWTVLPTDVLAAAQVTRWRGALPAHASLAYLERADREVFILPLYPRPGASRRVRAWVALAGESAAPTLRPGDFYYRSPVCSTPPGRRWCDAVEGAHALAPMEVASLPAIPSVQGSTYAATRVRVGLYRVTGSRE